MLNIGTPIFLPPNTKGHDNANILTLKLPLTPFFQISNESTQSVGKT
jgi:hypothetical protein